MSRPAALIAAFLTLMLQIELVPDAAQSFYWYNGSVYYTFMYALSLALYGLLIRLVLARTSARRGALTAVCTVLAVVQGGGNFVSGLVSALVLAGLLAGLALKKHPALRWMLLPAAAFAASFAACLLAPGTTRGWTITPGSRTRCWRCGWPFGLCSPRRAAGWGFRYCW